MIVETILSAVFAIVIFILHKLFNIERRLSRIEGKLDMHLRNCNENNYKNCDALSSEHSS